jgi:uncharacterized Zn-binding protein involved in type VI secretion
MPCAARIGDKIITGHTCSPVSSIISTLQAKVIIGGSPAAVSGSLIAPHLIRSGKFCVSHLNVTTGLGSTKVFFAGKSANRIGDSADMGCIISGSPKVLIGG